MHENYKIYLTYYYSYMLCFHPNDLGHAYSNLEIDWTKQTKDSQYFEEKTKFSRRLMYLGHVNTFYFAFYIRLFILVILGIMLFPFYCYQTYF